jgi:hypothetical protein
VIAVGIPASVWFGIAGLALVLGLLMLRASHRVGVGAARERQAWAERMGWEYLETDPVLPSRWRYGTIHQGGPGTARNLVTGTVPTPEGRRLVHVFDHEQAGRLSAVVLAVQRRNALHGALELRLPSAPLPDDAGLELLEQVGQRFAFVTDAATITPLITPRLARAADAIGDDIELVWAEDAWVLCTAPLDYSADMLGELLDALVDVAAALEQPGGRGGSRELRGVGSEEPPAEESASAAATWARSFASRSSSSAKPPADDEYPDSAADPDRDY